MSNLEKRNEPGKLALPSLEGLEFENDFGQTPLGLGHFSQDQGFIAVASLVGAFVGTAIAGLPMAAAIVLIGLNDIRFAGKSDRVLEPEESAIDVEASEVEQPEVGSNTRLNAVVVEGVEEENDHPPSSLLQPERWTRELMGYPSILIYGAAGAGKTSTAAWLIHERLKLGHTIKVLDPHREYGQWEGLECIGDGMDYDAINSELEAFTDEIKHRYQLRASTPDYNPPKLTLVCDEFTQWAKKCSHSAAFFEESLTDIRKINLHVLFISHARTLTGLGGSSGLAATRDAGLLELELEAQVDPVTKKASPRMEGWLKYPGQTLNERQRVAIATWMNGSMKFSPAIVPNDVRQRLEFLWDGSTAEPNPEPSDPTVQKTEPLNHPTEPLNPPNIKGYEDLDNGSQFSSEPSEPRFTPLNLTREQVMTLIENLNSELNQTQIIERLWQVKKGGSAAWKEAREQYRQLMGD